MGWRFGDMMIKAGRMSSRASRGIGEASPSAPARPEGAPAHARSNAAPLVVAPPPPSPSAPARGSRAVRHGPDHADVPPAPTPAAPGDRPPDAPPSAPSEALRDDFARRFAESYRTLWTIAAGIVNDPAIAEDVVQDAAVTALGKLHEFRPESNFTAWMAQIVRFIALNTSRRGRRQPTPLDPTAMDDSMSMSRQTTQHPAIAMWRQS